MRLKFFNGISATVVTLLMVRMMENRERLLESVARTGDPADTLRHIPKKRDRSPHHFNRHQRTDHRGQRKP